MNVEIINDIQNIPSRFIIWLKCDLECPYCHRKSMVVKIRNNGEIGYFHGSSGIILACENWGKCESLWNDIGNGRDFPYHTWLSSFHKRLDSDRGSLGKQFLYFLNKEYPDIYEKLINFDYEILDNTKIDIETKNIIKRLSNF